MSRLQAILDELAQLTGPAWSDRYRPARLDDGVFWARRQDELDEAVSNRREGTLVVIPEQEHLRIREGSRDLQVLVLAGAEDERNLAKVSVWGTSRVAATGSVSVLAFDSAEVHTVGCAHVCAYDAAIVNAAGDGTVCAFDNSKVSATGTTEVWGYQHAHVAVSGVAQAWGYESAHVHASDAAIARALDASTANVCDNAKLRALDRAQISVSGSGEVWAFGQVHVQVQSHGARVRAVPGPEVAGAVDGQVTRYELQSALLATWIAATE